MRGSAYGENLKAGHGRRDPGAGLCPGIWDDLRLFYLRQRGEEPVHRGANEITITEEYDPPDEIVPGEDTAFAKRVQVENTGTVPCYVRVRLEYSDSGMKEFCVNVLGEHRAPAGQW